MSRRNVTFRLMRMSAASSRISMFLKCPRRAAAVKSKFWCLLRGNRGIVFGKGKDGDFVKALRAIILRFQRRNTLGAAGCARLNRPSKFENSTCSGQFGSLLMIFLDRTNFKRFHCSNVSGLSRREAIPSSMIQWMGGDNARMLAQRTTDRSKWFA